MHILFPLLRHSCPQGMYHSRAYTRNANTDKVWLEKNLKTPHVVRDTRAHVCGALCLSLSLSLSSRMAVVTTYQYVYSLSYIKPVCALICILIRRSNPL